jgi:N-acetylmuramoyl-L-alanine amidase
MMTPAAPSLRFRERASPNHGPRPDGGRIDMLVLHYTGMPTAREALERLCDPAAEVSAHWLVEEDGTVWRLVDETRRAWHAGRACWAGEADVNGLSIGVEIHNPGHEHGYRPFPPAQMAAVAELCRGILARHPIPPHRVLGHSDVAPQRKDDPGELFDWAGLAREGIGLWPAFPTRFPPLPRKAAARALSGLARIGYEVPGTDGLDQPTRKVLAAFQRHFRPSCWDGALDAETLARVQTVASCVPSVDTPQTNV